MQQILTEYYDVTTNNFLLARPVKFFGSESFFASLEYLCNSLISGCNTFFKRPTYCTVLAVSMTFCLLKLLFRAIIQWSVL